MSKLALNGGIPVKTDTFPKWPMYDEKEEQALIKVLHSGVWGTLGSEVLAFNQKFAAYQGAKYAIGVTNGTHTLEIILRALDIGIGDEVIVPPYTFNATVSSVLMVGATPVFADLDGDTYNIDPAMVEKAITKNTKAVIPVHIGGRACDMDSIMTIANKYHLFVIEDAAHAVGSEWKGTKVGTIGNAGSFSFQASKNLTAGEGGAITTNDEDLYDKCFSIHHCGRDMKSGLWYDHPFMGTNARLTEWQAAILNVQMDRLDAQLELRMKNAAYLNDRLKELPCTGIMKPDERVTRNAYHLFVFKYFAEKCKGLPRAKFIDAMKAEGIPCAPGYVCLYKQGLLASPQAKRILRADANYDIFLPNAEKACYEEGMWLYQYMLLGTQKDMDDIVEAVVKVYENADELLK